MSSNSFSDTYSASVSNWHARSVCSAHYLTRLPFPCLASSRFHKVALLHQKSAFLVSFLSPKDSSVCLKAAVTSSKRHLSAVSMQTIRAGHSGHALLSAGLRVVSGVLPEVVLMLLGKGSSCTGGESSQHF